MAAKPPSDRLAVIGSQNISVTLAVGTIGGFMPATRTTFVVMDYGSRTGTVAIVTSGCTSTYNTAGVTVTRD